MPDDPFNLVRIEGGYLVLRELSHVLGILQTCMCPDAA